MLSILLALLLLVVLAAIATPLWRKDPHPIAIGRDADQTQDYADLMIEREVLIRSLNELDVELAQGRLTPKDHTRLKATDERQLLRVLDRLETLQAAAPTRPARPSEAPRASWAPSVATALVVLIAAPGVYAYLQWQADQRMAALRTQVAADAPNPLEMVARLEQRLRQNPDDLQGQIMAGRSYMALERLPEAKRAWAKVLELDPRNHEAHYSYGVILLNTRQFDDPELFTVALSHFDRALVNVPREPAVNWYRGLALWYLKRYSEADDAWTTAAQNLAPGSEDAEFVKAALIKLRAGQVPF